MCIRHIWLVAIRSWY